jgi:hypothetical protein
MLRMLILRHAYSDRHGSTMVTISVISHQGGDPPSWSDHLLQDIADDTGPHGPSSLSDGKP